jgi:hypothetical protein
MAITNRLMSPGNYSVSFSQEFTPTAIIEAIKEWGHIVVTPQPVDINTLSDSDVLSAAAYTGIVLNRTLEEGVVTVSGQGLELYMGDGAAKGMVIAESKNIGKVRNYTGTTLSETLFNSSAQTNKPLGLMLDESGNTQAITQGTIYNPSSTYTGSHFVETALSALKFVSEILNTEYRVNPNGTLDAGPTSNLFNGVGSSEPNTIVVKTAYGEDPEFEGIVPQGLRTEFDATDWVSRVDFTGEVGSFNEPTDVAGEANLTSNPYKDLHGNALKRVGLVQEPDVPEANLNSRAQLMLTELSRVKKVLNLDLTQYEVSGDLKAGDYIYAFDPDIGFVDTSTEAAAESRDLYEVTFRGEVINPIKVRVVGITFPIIDTMGVYFRDKDGNYTNLTEYVQFENGSAQVELGDVLRTIGDDLRFSEHSLSRETAGAFSIPDLPDTPTLQSGTYLNATGDSAGFIRVVFDKPTNVDGSQITDGSHYRVRYKQTTDSQYSYMNFPFTGASSESLLIRDLSVGIVYDVGVAAVDKSGFKKQSAYDGTGEDLYTNSSSINANYATNARVEIEKDGQAPSKPKIATIATGPLRVQVTHYLGKDGTDGGGNPYGNFTLEGDLEHLDVHAVTQDGNVQDFTVATSNKIGEIRVGSGSLLHQIPVVGSLELPDSEDYYFRIVAVDKSGNASDPSDGQAGNATLMEQAHIGDASITTAKIGTAQITNAKIADATIESAKIYDLSADKIVSGTITGGEITVGGVSNTDGFIRSYNYVADSAGWTINSDGTAEFQDVTIRGDLNASDIVTGTLDASNLTVTNLNASSITTGTFNADRIPTITTSKINFDAGDIGGAPAATIIATINDSSESSITIDADKLNLTGVLSVGSSISSGNVGGMQISSNYIRSSSYGNSSGNDGFIINSDGNATFNNVTVRGNIGGTIAANTNVTSQLAIGTGGKIRSASGNTYIEMRSDNASVLSFVKSGGTFGQVYDSSGYFGMQSGINASGLVLAASVGPIQLVPQAGIYVDGGIGNSNQVITGGNSPGWSSVPSTSGVTSISGDVNFNFNDNTGTVLIGSNHTHNTNNLVFTNNNSFNAAVNHSNHSTHNHNNTNLTNLGNSNVITTGNQNNNHKHDNSAHNTNYGFSNLVLGNNTGTAAGATHTHGYNTSNEANTNNIASFTKNYANSAANSRVVQHEFEKSHSDERLKTDVVSTSLGLDFLKRLNPVDFNWTQDYLDAQWVTDEDNNQISPNTNTMIEKNKLSQTNLRQGFIAQEVKSAVYAETGSNNSFSGVSFGDYTEYDASVTGGADDMGRIDYVAFVPVLVKAVQQLSAKIDVLEARVDELEGA